MAKTKLTDEWGFFTPVPELVIEAMPELGTDAVTLFMYLRYKTHRRKGSAWPSYTQISEATGWGRRRISNAIKALDAGGWLSKRKRFSNTTVYTLTRPPHVGGASSSEMELMDAASNRATEPQKSRNGTTEVAERDATQDLTTQDLKDPRQKRARNSAHPLSAQLYRSNLLLTPPKQAREIMEQIVDGRYLDWARHLRWWALKGYSPKNYGGVLDAFTKDGRRRGYTNAHRRTPLEVMKSYLAQRKELTNGP